MADGRMNVTKLDFKSYNEPDKIRAFDKTHVEVARLAGFTLSQLKMEPRWR